MPTGAEAAALATLGFRVFRIRERDKKPAIKAFPELATSDASVIRAEWGSDGAYNIGIATGNGYVVFDLDLHKHLGIKEAFTKAGGHFETRIHVSPQGGWHVFYRLKPDDHFMTVQNVISGIDVRCDGGYVVGPGSMIIDMVKGIAGFYEVRSDLPMADLPDALRGILKPAKSRRERLNGHADSEKSIPLYRDYLLRLAPPAIEGQGGNQTTYGVACMGVRDYGLTPITVWNLMLEDYNFRCVPPWDRDDLERIVENADNYAIGDLGSRDPDVVLSEFRFNPIPPPVADPGLFDTAAFDPDNIPAQDWLMPHFLLRGELTILAGPSGVGKSSLMLTAAAHAAVGRQFGILEPRYAFDSLVVNAEDSVAVMQGRLWAACKVHHIDYEPTINGGRVKLFDDSLGLILADVQGGKIVIPQETIAFFDEVMRRHPTIKVFFLDPLGQMMGSGINENDNGQMGIVMRLLVWLARRYNVALVIGQHVPKRLQESKDFDPSSMDNVRGASAITGRARIVTVMWGQTLIERVEQGTHPDVVSARFVKNSYGWYPREPSWFQRKVEYVKASNDGLHRDSYVTLEPVNGRALISAVEARRIEIIGKYLIEFSMTAVGPETAATWILSEGSGELSQDSEVHDIGTRRGMADKLRKMFARGARTFQYIADNGDTYIMSLDVSQSRAHQIVMLPTSNKIVLPTPVLPMGGAKT